MLDEAEIVSHLARRGLTCGAAANGNGVLVGRLEGRNLLCRVEFEGAAPVLLKRAVDSATRRGLEREALIHDRIAGFTASAAPATPRKLDYDAASSTLVVEFLPRHEPLSQWEESDDWPVGLADELGSMLARLHSLPVPDVDSARPWILELVHPPVETLREATYRQLELIGWAQRSRIWCDALEGLAEEWTPRTFVHGDLRLSNILRKDPVDPADSGLAFIDWELAGRGDPSWDTAWLVAGILAARSRDPASALPLVRSFWDGYAAVTRDATTAATLEATLRWCAAACLQMAYEEARWPEAGEARIHSLLRSGRSFLEQSGVWIDRVFLRAGG